MSLPLKVLPSLQMSTPSSRIATTSIVPVTARPSGVVLKYVAPPVEMWNAPHWSAAVPSATVGNERFVLDAPPGFSDSLQLSSPRIQELAESISSPSDRVLFFALTDADLRMFMVGDRPEFRRYMVISTPTRLERERVDRELFALNVGDAMRDMGKPAPNDD